MLRPQQERFLAEYLGNGGNATAAYRVAYPKCKSDDTAGTTAARLLGNARVKERLAELQAAVEKEAVITAADVLAGLKREAEFTGKGSSQAARIAAWSWIGRHLAMFVDRHEHSYTDADDDAALSAELERRAARQAQASSGQNGTANGPSSSAGNGRHDAGPVAG